MSDSFEADHDSGISSKKKARLDEDSKSSESDSHSRSLDKLKSKGKESITRPSPKKRMSSSPGASTSKSIEEINDEASQYLGRKREKQQEERIKMQVLVSNFSTGQLNRYEMFRRAAFPKAAIKRIMQSVAGTSVGQNVVIAMSGISKVYVGEIVEQALDVMEAWGDTGPLQPRHIREAVRRLKTQASTSMPNTRSKKYLFR